MEREKIAAYKIRVKGHLDGHWSDWFDGLTITNLENGEALLYGDIVDQAALHGMLNKVRDLSLPLVAVRRASATSEDPAARTSTTKEIRTRESLRHHYSRNSGFSARCIDLVGRYQGGR